MPGQLPSLVSTSLWQTPQACTLMRTCPTPGLGISRSTISKSAPGLLICAAFIGAIAILVVAMFVSSFVSIEAPEPDKHIWPAPSLGAPQQFAAAWHG